MQVMEQGSETEITIRRTEDQVVEDTPTEGRAEQQIDTNETKYENGRGVSSYLIWNICLCELFQHLKLVDFLA